jgi:predicted transcriptional regulator
MKSRYLGMRLPPDLWRSVQASVASSGKTQAAWLRAAIAHSVERQELLAAIETLLVASERRLSARFLADLDAAMSSIEIFEEPTSHHGENS